MSETNIENEPSYSAEPTRWLRRLMKSIAIAGRGIALLPRSVLSTKNLFQYPPPRWMNHLAIAGGVVTLLAISAMSMLGAAFLLVVNGYGQ